MGNLSVGLTSCVSAAGPAEAAAVQVNLGAAAEAFGPDGSKRVLGCTLLVWLVVEPLCLKLFPTGQAVIFAAVRVVWRGVMILAK